MGGFKVSAWSDDDLRAMERMARKGMPASSIAGSLGRSTMAVYKMAEKRGVPLMSQRPWTAEDDDALRGCVSGGMRASDAARSLGRTTYAVFNRMRRLGLRAPVKRYDWGAVEDMAASGVSADEAARSQGTTRRRLEEAARARYGVSYTSMLDGGIPDVR